jgi:hypothetical protein
MSRTSRADKRKKQKRHRRNLEKTLAHSLKAAAAQTPPKTKPQQQVAAV